MNVDQPSIVGTKQHASTQKQPIIDVSIIEATLSRICHIPKQKVEKNEVKSLRNLEKRLKK